MKRILIVLAALLTFIPCVAKADMGAPEVMSYFVTPKNIEGANYYDESSFVTVKGKIKHGEKVEVIYDYTFDDEDYGAISIGEDEYYINLSDFNTVVDFYKPKDGVDGVYKVDSKAKVLNKSGLVMYKGPSTAYGSLNVTIPFGTDINVTYESAGIWNYTKYNGTEGWVLGYLGTLGSYVNDLDDPLVMASDLKITESVSYNAKVVGTIPAFERVYEYYLLDEWAWSYYITYNGVSGYIDSTSQIVKSDDQYLSGNNIADLDLNIYQTASYDNKKKIGTLPKITEFKVLGYVGHHDEWYYIQYGDTKGFIETYIDELETGVTFINENDKYYNDVKSGKMTFEEYNNTYDEDYDDNEDPDIEEDPSIEDDDQDTDDDKEVEPGIGSNDKSSTDKNNTKKDEGIKISPTDLVLLCVCGALVIALTAVVTIVLVNKKKVANTEVVAPTPVVESAPVSTETQNTEVVETKEEETENKVIS